MAPRTTIVIATWLMAGALIAGACVPPGQRIPIAATTATPAANAPTAVAAAAPAAKPAAQPATAGDPARGKQTFTGTCVGCPGPEAKGRPGLGKDLTTSAFVKSQDDQQLVDFIKHGRPSSDPANTTHVDMPPKGGNPALTDAQLADIVAFIRTINK